MFVNFFTVFAADLSNNRADYDMRKRLNKKQIKALLYSLFDYQRFIGNKHLNNAILQALQEDEKLEDMELDAVAGGTTSDKQINHLEG